MDKAARVGIRIADLLDKDIFRERLERNLAEKNRLLKNCMTVKRLFSMIFLKNITNMVNKSRNTIDTSVILNDALDNGKRVLLKVHKVLC